MLYNIPLQDNIVQGFRAVHKSYGPFTFIHINPDDTIHINCYTDPETRIDFIHWDEIQRAFEEELFVRCRTNLLPYLKGADYRPLEPKRIAVVPGVVLDIIVGGELVVLRKVAYPNKERAAIQSFLHIDYTLKVPMPNELLATSQGSQGLQNAGGSSAQKVEGEVSSPKPHSRIKTPLLLLLTSPSRHRTLEDLTK